jgi:4-hydroxy-tetrahydrodipicolinate reductase
MLCDKQVMRIVLIGHGRMGRLVESLAPSHGCEIAGILTSRAAPTAIAAGSLGAVDVAVDFSQASAVPGNLAQLASRGINAVIGTTGWQSDEPACRELVERTGIGVIVSANFAIGISVFRAVVEEAARLFGAQGDVGAWIHELHHVKKKDAPSGTALLLRAAMERGGFTRAIDVSSTRAGSIPGTHTVGFDAASETVTLTHAVRDRSVFAHGALEAAKWIKGRVGWYTVQDMIRQS